MNIEITSITANIDALKADLKEKRTALKKAEKEGASLEAKKAKADAKATEEAASIRHDGRRYPRKPEIKQYAVWTEFQKFTRRILEHDI